MNNSRQGRWRKRHPLKYLAHRYVANALSLGVLKKQPCEVCGNPKVDAHHDDYAKPMVVRWLCRAHHNEHHAEGKRLGAGQGS